MAFYMSMCHPEIPQGKVTMPLDMLGYRIIWVDYSISILLHMVPLVTNTSKHVALCVLPFHMTDIRKDQIDLKTLLTDTHDLRPFIQLRTPR